MLYRNDVIRSSSYRCMMLAQGQKHSNVYCLQQTTCKNSDGLQTVLNLNPIVHLSDLLTCKVRAQPLLLNPRELTRVNHQKCAAIQSTVLFVTLRDLTGVIAWQCLSRYSQPNQPTLHLSVQITVSFSHMFASNFFSFFILSTNLYTSIITELSYAFVFSTYLK